MSETALSTWTRRARYAARQGARVTWFAAHGELAQAITRRVSRRHRTEEAEAPSPAAPRKPRGNTPDQRRLFAQIADLFRRALANIEAGH